MPMLPVQQVQYRTPPPGGRPIHSTYQAPDTAKQTAMVAGMTAGIEQKQKNLNEQELALAYQEVLKGGLPYAQAYVDDMKGVDEEIGGVLEGQLNALAPVFQDPNYSSKQHQEIMHRLFQAGTNLLQQKQGITAAADKKTKREDLSKQYYEYFRKAYEAEPDPQNLTLMDIPLFKEYYEKYTVERERIRAELEKKKETLKQRKEPGIIGQAKEWAFGGPQKDINDLEQQLVDIDSKLDNPLQLISELKMSKGFDVNDLLRLERGRISRRRSHLRTRMESYAPKAGIAGPDVKISTPPPSKQQPSSQKRPVSKTGVPLSTKLQKLMDAYFSMEEEDPNKEEAAKILRHHGMMP